MECLCLYTFFLAFHFIATDLEFDVQGRYLDDKMRACTRGYEIQFRFDVRGRPLVLAIYPHLYLPLCLKFLRVPCDLQGSRAGERLLK